MEKNHNKPSILKAEILFLSLGGIGFIPKAPGTIASIATLVPLFILGKYNAPFILFIPLLLIMLGVSIFLTEEVHKKYKIEDPSWIVIDEFFGIFAMWPFLQNNWVQFLFGFVLFRALDIFKPGPIGLIDKKLKNGFGVMLDDVLSGLIAGLICRILFHFIPIA